MLEFLLVVFICSLIDYPLIRLCYLEFNEEAHLYHPHLFRWVVPKTINRSTLAILLISCVSRVHVNEQS